MKDILRELLAEAAPGVDPRNIVREYLQARVLESMQRLGALAALAFHGGTALRFLYRTPRYSEDLDFALLEGSTAFGLRDTMTRVGNDLRAEAYAVEMGVRDAGPVHSAKVAFPGLPAELGLSTRPEEKLVIKVDVDTNPPVGATTEISIVRRFVTLRLQHHDRASLLAGKVNAILTRGWIKGRDVYDLVWYLADPEWPSPNLTLLNNALEQFGYPAGPLAEATWRAAVQSRLAEADMADVIADVSPFLERVEDRELLSRENLELLLKP
ncbi:MAG: nucleotidyl transferase AbiEii/AbiGii toxin family protein [Actinobacteria bacterium]|nr:nucleotidyl transferase AbiEii/AbiGii toxin family protein [Actinomycetota bacterium]